MNSKPCLVFCSLILSDKQLFKKNKQFFYDYIKTEKLIKKEWREIEDLDKIYFKMKIKNNYLIDTTKPFSQIMKIYLKKKNRKNLAL